MSLPRRPEAAQPLEPRLETQRKLAYIHRLNLMVDIIDLLGFAAFFALNAREESADFFHKYARFVIMPLTALMTVARTGLAWYQAITEDFKAHTVVRSGIESISAVTIPTAIIGGFAAEKEFATLAPRLFAGTLSLKTLYNLLAGVYNWGKSSAPGISEQRREDFFGRAKGHGMGAFILGLAAAGVILAMIIAQGDVHTLPGLVGITLGITGTSIGLLLSIYYLHQSPSPEAREGYVRIPESDDHDNVRRVENQMNNAPALTQNARVHQILGATGIDSDSDEENVAVLPVSAPHSPRDTMAVGPKVTDSDSDEENVAVLPVSAPHSPRDTSPSNYF